MPFFSLVKKKPYSPEADYIRALGFMIDGQTDQALQLMVQLVKRDSENAEVYCRLGTIYRLNGQVPKAVRIHKTLLIRPNLSPDMLRRIQMELIRDYVQLKNFNGVGALVKAVQENTRDLLQKQELLKIYEAVGDWDMAFELKKEIMAGSGDKETEVLAFYLCKKAENIVLKNGRESRIVFKDALKIDPQCVWALMGIGDSYVKERRFSDAIRFYRMILERAPLNAFLIFDRMEKIFFEIGNYGEVGKIYRALVDRDPQDYHARVALANHYKKLGEHAEAIVLCESVLQKKPDLKKAVHLLISLYSETGNKCGLERTVAALVGQFPPADAHVCAQCHYSSHEPLWHCPQCRSWNSFGI